MLTWTYLDIPTHNSTLIWYGFHIKVVKHAVVKDRKKLKHATIYFLLSQRTPKCKYDELTFFLVLFYIFRETEKGDEASSLISSPTRSPTNKAKPDPWVLLEGFWLIVSSPYLLAISLFLWLSAVVSSFFYFQVVIFFFCFLFLSTLH